MKLLIDEDDLISLRNYHRKRGVSWFSCEVLGLTKEAARTVQAGPCKKIIVGEVMSACGRVSRFSETFRVKSFSADVSYRPFIVTVPICPILLPRLGFLSSLSPRLFDAFPSLITQFLVLLLVAEHQAVDWKRHKKTCFEQQW